MALIEIRGISKAYGGVRALKSLDLAIRPGEVLAVCGENGAGKSTLNRILSGSLLPDEGTIRVDGDVVQLGSVQEAERRGISIVHQESSAFLDLDASENHELMHEPGVWWLERNRMRRNTEASLAAVGESFPVEVPLGSRSVAQRQMVAIARATQSKCRLLILDEATASLSSRETDALFEVIRRLRASGVAILYVSHRLNEIFELADRVAVLRDGLLVGDLSIGETSPHQLIELMVGREIEFSQRVPVTVGETRLLVDGLSTDDVEGITFQVRSGEVVALAGLVGAGRSEIARAIFGIDPVRAGTIQVDGHLLKRGVQAAISAGVALVPEDRQHEGLHLPLTVRENLMMAAGPHQGPWINQGAESARSSEIIRELGIKAQSMTASVSSLSGGNQQKTLLGKWLENPPRVLILDEPTRGVDVAAKDQIHRLISKLAEQGVAIGVISSEMSEVVALADRVVVINQGRNAGTIERSEISQSRILELALPGDRVSPPIRASRVGIPRSAVIACLLGIIILGTSGVNPGFLAIDNLRDLLVRFSPTFMLSVGMTMVILMREIDISIGSLMGLCAASLGICASADRLGLPPTLSALVCLGVGCAGGLLNGALVVFARIPSIIVTLGTLTLFRAATEIAMGGRWIEKLPDGLRQIGSGSFGGVPIAVSVALLVGLAGVWLTRRTRLGLRAYAIGSNPSAAELRGVDSRRIKLAVFVIMGLISGIAALVSSTQLQVIESGFGSGMELLVISAVIVGGTSIRGGKGSVFGSLLGTALLGVISSALVFLHLGDAAVYWERAIQGAFILLAVVGDSIIWRRRS